MVARHSPLKVALFNSGRRQIVIAKMAGLHESRLSKLAHGHHAPTPAEKAALARVLRIRAEDLFPASDEATV